MEQTQQQRQQQQQQQQQEEAVPEDVLVDYDDDDDDDDDEAVEEEDHLLQKQVMNHNNNHNNHNSKNVPAAAAALCDPPFSPQETHNLVPSHEERPQQDQPTERPRPLLAATATAVDNGNPDKHNSTTSTDITTSTTTTTAAKNATMVHSRPTASASARKGGGIYIPPFRRRLVPVLEDSEPTAASSLPPNQQKIPVASATASSSSSSSTQSSSCDIESQRQQWYQLQKNIRGTINRLNTQTLKPLLLSILQKPHTNLIRGKGILAKSIIRSATISPSHAPVYASFLAVLHSKLPEIGELVLARSILLFRKSYARQDRDRTLALANFIGCLFNQGMCHEILCLQMLTLLLADDDATDESVEVAIRLVQVVGKKMMEVSPAGLYAVMERFRSLLHEGESATAVVSRRVQFKLQHVLEVRKRKFEEFPTLLPELDLVEVEDQIMLEMGLDDEDLKMEDHLDVFQFDQDWVLHEKEWLEIQKEILGHDPDEEKEKEEEDEEEESDTEKSANDSQEDEDDDDEEEEDGVLVETTNKKPTAITTTTTTAVPSKAQTIIQDMSEKDLIHLRRTIYLTIMSSATFEECAHKLSKMDIPTGKEMELINMIIECCSQERTFLRYYGLIASRFCLLHNRWKDAFHQAFIVQYNTIHRLETNKLRNVAKLFAHLLYTDSLSWSCLSVIHLNEDETTSSSRIFLKILIQEMAQAIGMEKLLNRFETKDPEEASWFQELFPRDYNQPRKTRYAINFFTSIGLGPLTDGLREHLKQAPKLIRMQAAEISGGRGDGKEGGDADSDASSVLSSSSSSVSSSSTSTYSSSRSSSSYSSSSLSSSSSSESHTSDSYNRGKARMRRRRRRDSYSDDSSTSSSVSPSPSRRNSKRSNSRESRRRGTKQKRSSSNRPTTTTDPRDHGRNRRYRHASRSSSATEDSRHSRHGPRGRTSRSSPRDSSRDRYDVDRKSLKRERETSRAGHSSQSSNDRQKKMSSRSNNKRRRSVSESSSSGSYRSSDSGYDSKRSSHPRRKRSESTKFRRE